MASKPHENFRSASAVAAVAFDLRVRAQRDTPLFVKSRDLAARVGLTKRQVGNAIQFVASDDDSLDISQWSSPGTYPKVWEVRRSAE